MCLTTLFPKINSDFFWPPTDPLLCIRVQLKWRPSAPLPSRPYDIEMLKNVLKCKVAFVLNWIGTQLYKFVPIRSHIKQHCIRTRLSPSLCHTGARAMGPRVSKAIRLFHNLCILPSDVIWKLQMLYIRNTNELPWNTKQLGWNNRPGIQLQMRNV